MMTIINRHISMQDAKLIRFSYKILVFFRLYIVYTHLWVVWFVFSPFIMSYNLAQMDNFLCYQKERVCWM